MSSHNTTPELESKTKSKEQVACEICDLMVVWMKEKPSNKSIECLADLMGQYLKFKEESHKNNDETSRENHPGETWPDGVIR